MDRCNVCQQEWRERYNLSVQRFDRQINRCMAITVVAVIISMFCIIITALCVAKTIQFINGFEYVEEEQTLIEQDGNGQNIAVLVDKSGA